MDIYLARLQQKPIPNIKNKDGVQVFFSKTELVSPEVDENLIERDEDGEIVADYNETDKQEVKKSLCKIQDGRKESKLGTTHVCVSGKRFRVLAVVADVVKTAL